MRLFKRTNPALALTMCASVATTALAASQVSPAREIQGESGIPALPQTPSPTTVPTIVMLRPVVLAKSYPTDFRADHASVTGGWLMVIKADSSILAPRSVAEPLLLAGGKNWNESVEWFNHGYASGHRVCFIPSPVNDKGELAHSTESLQVWFGTPKLPESVTADELTAQRALADRAGITPVPAAQVAAATAAGALGPTQLDGRDALVAAAAELVAIWAPDESQVAAPVAPATK